MMFCSHACEMCTPHLPCYIKERRKDIYIYMKKKREICQFITLIKLYLNSQIRNSTFPTVSM